MMRSLGEDRADGGPGRIVVCVTVDVEGSDIESLTRIRATCQRHGAPVTWFVEPRLCSEDTTLDVLRSFTEQGDEVGLHIHWSGSYVSGLGNLPGERISAELDESLRMLSPRFRVKSFRGGGLCQTTAVLDVVSRKGFEYDSSVACGLDEPDGWHQGHARVLPLSAYYPSPRGYDVVGRDDGDRLDILEMPVTRGLPPSRVWCGMLEPDLASQGIMKQVFQQYYVRRQFQPLVLMLVILHSWSPGRHKTTIPNLDRFLAYARSRESEFGTVAAAGRQWKELWDRQPAARELLLQHQFSFDLNTRVMLQVSRLAVLAHSLRKNPVYYVTMVTSKARCVFGKPAR